MVANTSLGPLQIQSLDLSSMNLAFMELQNRIDVLRGLRGRSLVHDRQRIDSPTVSDDAVDLQSLVTQEFRWRLPWVMHPGYPVLAPGTTYAEVASLWRMPIDFADLTSPEARIIVAGFGTNAGTGKGVAMTTSTGTVLAEVTWDGTDESIRVGTFTTIAAAQLIDQQVQLRAKGSVAAENLILRQVHVEFRGVIRVIAA